MHLAPTHRRGFTLLELVISLALVLVLMLAITKIFSITSTTIGASQGIAAATRDARAAQAVFAHDIGSMASDSPFIWIRYDRPFSAFRNADDERADRDGKALTVDLNDDGTEGDSNVKGEAVSGVVTSPRRHRLDRFAFCARDRFARQTGNTAGNILVSGLKSAEAMIYYGPLVLPNNNGAFQLSDNSGVTSPGAGTSLSLNPNNYYSSQFILGRFAPLMVSPNTGTTAIKDGTVAQEYYPHNSNSSLAGQLSPFSSTTTSVNATPASQVVDARYDLFGVDIATYKTLLEDYIALPAHNPVTTTNNWRAVILNSMFQVNPFLIKPIRADTAARQVPIFVNSCSQFIVEYAGDFVEQDETGLLRDVNANGSFYEPDGKVDFVVVNGARQIKWYGYPRDMDGDEQVIVSINSPDVSPVSDFAYPDNTPFANTFSYNVFESYGAASTPPANTRKLYTDTPSNFSFYYAAWGPGTIDNPTSPRPKMYRITLSIDRPEMAGRSADSQTFEYVFSVP